MSRPDDDYQARILRGIFEQAFQRDMNVAVFSTSNALSYADCAVYPQRIFELPNPEKLSGIIYVPDTISGFDTHELTDRLKAVNQCKVIAVDSAIEGMKCLISDYDIAIDDIVCHLTEVHNCKRIAFMAGFKGNLHSEGRLSAFRASMNRCGLEVDESLIYYGDFWYDCGKEVADSLVADDSNIPDAIICASERMAYSVYTELLDRGYNVPADIIIAGYSDGGNKFDFITSCGKNAEAIGRETVNMLLETELSDCGISYINDVVSVNCSFTCGCMHNPGNYFFRPKEDMFSERGGYFSLNNDMADKLLKTQSFSEFFGALDWYTLFLGDYEHFSIALSEGWDELLPQTKRSYSRETKMQLVLRHDNTCDGGADRSIRYDRKFDIADIHPVLWENREHPGAFFFMPLLSDDRNFGYVALSYGNEPRTIDEICAFWIKDVIHGFESQKRLFAMRYLYDEMQKYAVTDRMTLLNNRNGYNLKIKDIVRSAKKERGNVAVIMGDLNCLKYINDTFGHEQGDTAIVTAARAFSNAKIMGAVCEENFRMGGDEFLKIAYGNFTESTIETYISRIRTMLEEENRDSSREYPVYLSLGYCVMSSDNAENIDSMVTKADVEMYADKQRLKQSTGFNHQRNNL